MVPGLAGIVEMPGGHVQCGDARFPPARARNNPDPRASGRRRRRRPTGGVSGRAARSPGRKAHAADKGNAHSRARRDCGQPQNSTRAPAYACHHRRARPALASKDTRVLGDIEHRQIECVFPDDPDLRTMYVSSTFRTVMCFSCAWKPAASASADWPSRIREDPASTRASQASGVMAGSV